MIPAWVPYAALTRSAACLMPAADPCRRGRISACRPPLTSGRYAVAG